METIPKKCNRCKHLDKEKEECILIEFENDCSWFDRKKVIGIVLTNTHAKCSSGKVFTGRRNDETM